MAKDFFGQFARPNWPNGQWPTLAKRPNANPGFAVTYRTIRNKMFEILKEPKLLVLYGDLLQVAEICDQQNNYVFKINHDYSDFFKIVTCCNYYH